jgi:hypothetical protein
MVHKLRRPATGMARCRDRVAGVTARVAILVLGMAAALPAQEPGVHYLHQGLMPPGAIGSQQLRRGGPLPGFFQPVEIQAPYGVMISLAVGGEFEKPQAAPVRAGLLIAPVYRFRVSNIPRHPGEEVFPTVEVTDRLYTPRGQERRFAIPIVLTQQDLELALDGKFVTRVIYVEDPHAALAVQGNPQAQNWFEVPPGSDPLAVADQLGRPVAILRLGGRLPIDPQTPEVDFLAGCPPLEKYPPRIKILKPPPKTKPVPEAPPAAAPPQRPQP